MPGDLVNISLGGMKFRANSEIEAHSRIKIRLRMFDILSSDESANLDRIAEQMETVVVAKVLECRKSKTTGYDYRVKFESFRQGNLAVLAKFIQEQTA
jgi:c-di-GMP-binding flagellar brake protein YcgR